MRKSLIPLYKLYRSLTNQEEDILLNIQYAIPSLRLSRRLDASWTHF